MVNAVDIEIDHDNPSLLRTTLSGELTEIPALNLAVNGAPWATAPTIPDPTAPQDRKIWSCELPPLLAPASGELVELIDSRNGRSIKQVQLGMREPKRNGLGLLAAEVYGDGVNPLFSAPSMLFDGAVVTIRGAHLPPMGDPSKLRFVLGPGVAFTLEYPLYSPEFEAHYWFWPNAGWSGFHVSIDLAKSSAAADPFRISFVHVLDGAEKPGGAVCIPSQMVSSIGFPGGLDDPTPTQPQEPNQIAVFVGYNHFRLIAESLGKFGIAPRRGTALLDWQCGDGRVTRHFLDHWPGADIWGIDSDAEAIAFCKRRFGAGAFVHGSFTPSTPLATEYFDAVYSVKTMPFLRKEELRPWMEELARLLKPGGLALLAFSGECAAAYLSRYLNGDWWGRWRSQGYNDELCAPELKARLGVPEYAPDVFRSAESVKIESSQFFETLAIEPARFGYLDLAILRKR